MAHKKVFLKKKKKKKKMATQGNDEVRGQGDDEVRGLFARVRLNEIVSKLDGEGDVAAWIRQVRIAEEGHATARC